MAACPKISGYRITRLLGQGGMSNVYLARDGRLDRNVAVKILFDALAEDNRTTSRFIHEAKTAARLQHSNIIHIYNVGKHRRHYYIVMELLHGSLKQKIESVHSKPLFPEPGLSVLREIANALDYAHKQGVIHRDIKPDNIMFRNDMTPVLVDFGISRCIHSNARLTRTGMSIGTPHYMSPEQIRGKDIDGRSDLYSLGVVIYEMLTGEVPYAAEEAIAVAMKHVREPVPGLPESLKEYEGLVHGLMAKNPGDRPSSGAELIRMISALQESLDNKGSVSPTGIPSQASRPTDRLVASGPNLTATAVRPLRLRYRLKGLVAALAVSGLLLTGSVMMHRAGDSTSNPQPGLENSVKEKTAPTSPVPESDHMVSEIRKPDLEKRMRALMDETRFSEARELAFKTREDPDNASTKALKPLYGEIIAQMRAKRRVLLRSSPKDLNEAEARKRVDTLKIFDKTWNRSGDFPNYYQARKVHGHPVVIDWSSGLMWMREGSTKRYRHGEVSTWIDKINARRYAGFQDWRLPTVEEAASLLEPEKSPSGLYLNQIFDASPRRIWTSDAFPPRGFWYIGFSSGNISWNMLGWNRCNIRPVRSIFKQGK